MVTKLIPNVNYWWALKAINIFGDYFFFFYLFTTLELLVRNILRKIAHLQYIFLNIISYKYIVKASLIYRNVIYTNYWKALNKY